MTKFKTMEYLWIFKSSRTIGKTLVEPEYLKYPFSPRRPIGHSVFPMVYSGMSKRLSRPYRVLPALASVCYLSVGVRVPQGGEVFGIKS